MPDACIRACVSYYMQLLVWRRRPFVKNSKGGDTRLYALQNLLFAVFVAIVGVISGEKLYERTHRIGYAIATY